MRARGCLGVRGYFLVVYLWIDIGGKERRKEKKGKKKGEKKKKEGEKGEEEEEEEEEGEMDNGKAAGSW